MVNCIQELFKVFFTIQNQGCGFCSITYEVYFQSTSFWLIEFLYGVSLGNNENLILNGYHYDE